MIIVKFKEGLTALLTSCILDYVTKKKYPSELNTKHIRVNVGDYALLKELSIDTKLTIAELVHNIITNNLQDNINKTSPYQTQMPFRVSRIVPHVSRAIKINVRKEEGDG